MPCDRLPRMLQGDTDERAGEDVRADDPHPGRPLTITLWVLLAIYMVGMFLILIFAVIRSGDYGAFLEPGLDRLGDPMDSVPSLGPETWWNPLPWLLVIPYVSVVVFQPFPVAGLLFAVSSLLAARGRSVRAAAWTAVWVALTVLTYSPYGWAIRYWLLD